MEAGLDGYQVIPVGKMVEIIEKKLDIERVFVL
jgi:hypothetical protein